MEKDTKVKLANLYKNTSQGGVEYYSGSFTYGTKLLLYTNTYKKEDKDPDMILYIVKKERKPKEQAPAETTKEEDGEIPF